MRASSAGSERTTVDVGTILRTSPAFLAIGAQSRSSAASRSPMQKSVFSTVTAPASNLEMSSKVPSSASTLSSAPWMRRDELLLLVGQRPFGQRGDEQPRRIQRLQQIVAGGGKEAGLAEVRLLGVGLGQPQRLLHLPRARRFPGAACDSAR